jgi:hypothetical protein
MAIFLRPLLFSCDSFLGSLALGFGVRSNRQRIGLVAAFSLCDALASIAGSLLSTTFLGETAPEVLAPGLVAVYVLLLAVCVGSRRAAGGSAPWLLWTIPAVMSLDNLLDPSRAGASLEGVCAAAAFSAGASWLGFCLADGVRFLWHRRARALTALSS